jgi:AP-2 complex subunit mu-1
MYRLRLASGFRTKIIHTKIVERNPVNRIGNISCIHIKTHNLFLLATTGENINIALIFEMLFKLADLFESYLGEDFSEAKLKENFDVLYEIIDETIDFGVK